MQYWRYYEICKWFIFYIYLDLESVLYYKLTIAIGSPAFFGILLLIFWFGYKFCFAKKMFTYQAIEKFILTFSITISYFLPSVINSLAEFLNCTQLYSESYVTNQLSERCSNNPRYMLWRNALIFPSLFIFLFLFPLLALIYMHKNRDNLFQPNILQKISFLVNGYTSKTFYW